MLSLVTITYKNEDEFEKTLKSVESSDFKGELVVIDGGVSPIVKNLCEISSLSIQLIQEPDKGIYDAFNKGAQRANGSFVCYLNSGDILIDNGNYYHEAITTLEKNDHLSFTHSNVIFSDENLGSYVMKPKFGNIGKGILALHPSLVVKKRVFEEIGYFDLDFKISGDYDFIFRLFKNYQGMYFSKHAPVDMDGTGVSANQEFKAIIECGQALKKNGASLSERFYFKIRVGKYLARVLLEKAGLRAFKDFLRSFGKEKRKNP